MERGTLPVTRGMSYCAGLQGKQTRRWMSVQLAAGGDGHLGFQRRLHRQPGGWCHAQPTRAPTKSLHLF